VQKKKQRIRGHSSFLENYPLSDFGVMYETHTHTHIWFTIFVGNLQRRNGFYNVQTVYFIPLH